MNTIENINTVVNEDTVKIAVEAAEAIPVKKFDLAKLGKAGAVVGTVILLGVGTAAVIRHVVTKKNDKDITATGVDNVKVAEHDFVEKDSAEE